MTDSANKLMLECHFYDPFQFTQLTSDASWGAMYYFWGASYHVTSGPTNRNAASGEESYQYTELDKAQAFVTRGFPVLCGEWRAAPKPAESDLTGAYIQQNINSVSYWNYFMHGAMNARGLYCTAWDVPGETWNATTGAITDQLSVNALTGKSYAAPIPGL